MIYEMDADTDGVSITARGTSEDIGKAFEVTDDSGRRWFGIVDDDCIALLGRADILEQMSSGT
jgi:hypothetical protein